MKFKEDQFFFSKYPKAFLNEKVMNQITLFFAVQVLRKSGVYIFKVPQGDDEWNSNWR